MSSAESSELAALNLSPQAQWLLNTAGQFFYNTVLEKYEQPFTIRGGDRVRIVRIAEEIRSTMTRGHQVLLGDHDEVDVNHLLAAFRTVTSAMTEEVALVGLSRLGTEEPITSISARKGTANSVQVPEVARKEIINRIKRQEKFKIVLVHNHPKNIFHVILDAKAFGPSSADRELASSWRQRWQRTGGLVQSDFYVLEGGAFRKFVFPSLDTVFELFKGCLRK